MAATIRPLESSLFKLTPRTEIDSVSAQGGTDWIRRRNIDGAGDSKNRSKLGGFLAFRPQNHLRAAKQRDLVARCFMGHDGIPDLGIPSQMLSARHTRDGALLNRPHMIALQIVRREMQLLHRHSTGQRIGRQRDDLDA